MIYQLQRDLRRALQRDGCPATVCLLAASLLIFVLQSLTRDLSFGLHTWLAFQAGDWFTRPWKLVTGSLFYTDIWSAILGALWLWFIGGTLERSFGTRTLVALWAGISVVTALGLELGLVVTKLSAPLYLTVVLSALTVVWGALNRRASVLLMGILPLAGITMAWLSAIFVVIWYGWPIGVFALTGCVAGWLFVWQRERTRRNLGVLKIPRRPKSIRSREDPPGPAGRIQSWRRNRRIEKLMRESGLDGSDTAGRS
jgi:membrane associated rhomboid family serine protease